MEDLTGIIVTDEVSADLKAEVEDQDTGGAPDVAEVEEVTY